MYANKLYKQNCKIVNIFMDLTKKFAMIVPFRVLQHFTHKASVTSVNAETNVHSTDWLMSLFVNELALPHVQPVRSAVPKDYERYFSAICMIWIKLNFFAFFFLFNANGFTKNHILNVILKRCPNCGYSNWYDHMVSQLWMTNS